MKATLETKASGRVTLCQVLDAKTGKVEREYGPSDNLVLDAMLEEYCTTSERYWRDFLVAGSVSDRENQTRKLLNGTFSRSGTTVTRASGTGEFKTQTYRGLVASLTPVAYYPLDEASGTVVEDIAGSNLDGTLVNPSGYTYRGRSLVNKELSGAFAYASGFAYVNLGHPAELEWDKDAEPFSMSFWLSSSYASSGGDHVIIGKSFSSATSSSAADFALTWLQSQGGLRLRVGNTGTNFPVNLTSGRPHHIVVSSDGTVTSLYVDGVLAGTVTNGTTTEPTRDWWVGVGNSSGSPSGNTSFGIGIGHLAFFDRALSASEAADLTECSGDDAGNVVKWSSGQEARIVSVTSATEAQVDVSGTVAAAALAVWRTNLTMIERPVKMSVSYPEFLMADGLPSQYTIYNKAAGHHILRRTWDWTPETALTTYRSLAVSRYVKHAGDTPYIVIPFAEAVEVGIGKLIRCTYELDVIVPHTTAASRAIQYDAGSYSGWPVSYGISGITSNSSEFVITTSVAHHYIVGGKIIVSGATVSGYNGTWTIASKTSTTVTVTNASNFGTSSAGGTVTSSPKFTMYLAGNGLRQLADSSQYGYISTTAPSESQEGLGSENVLQPGKAVCRAFISTAASLPKSTNYPGDNLARWRLDGTYLDTLEHGLQTAVPAYGWDAGRTVASVLGSYTPLSFYRDMSFTFSPAAGNTSAAKILFVCGISGTDINAQMAIVFDEVQKKEATHSLAVTLRRSVSRRLAATPP